jgi:ABC-type multidrug transport system ATPase subunit
MEHVDQLLREVGLYEARHRYAAQLSGGMKRRYESWFFNMLISIHPKRLSLAISMVGYSRIIFLDEPTTGLDPASRRKIWAIISRAKHNRAIVLTTHSMDEAETVCEQYNFSDCIR